MTSIKTTTVKLPAYTSIKISCNALLTSWQKHIQRESLLKSLACSAEGPCTAVLARGADVGAGAVALWEQRSWHSTAGTDQQDYI